MDNLYGINVKNKFELFLDEDVDPLEILAQQESAKKAEAEKKKKEEKGGKKTKNAKKPVLKADNKNKVQEEIKPEREEKQNAPRQQNERPRTGRSARENKEPREDNRPPRRREENMNQENRPERFDGGFGRSEGGFPREGGPRDGNFRGGRGRGRGGRGMRGRGGAPTERGGFGGGKRDFDRHSGSDRTSGVKATDKREGSGSHNWGTVKDDIDLPPKVDYWRDPKEQLKDTSDEPQEWNQQNEDAENKDPNESTESATAGEEGGEEDQPKQLTLEEWKRMEDQKRVKSSFKLRKAGEGVDSTQWKTGRVYRKSEGNDDSDEEDDEDDEDDDEDKPKRLVNEIKITFNDSPRRGRGGRRPRGPRGGRGGTGRGIDKRGGGGAAPKFEDENEFPSLIKTAA